ncbi:MAG TPA: nuclear transport factor 2 family protein [Gammaproteobacteria bacterium]|nr:nuclear transport factor 2 family protein [Gammaproteobacteria bacterium]
MGSEDASEKNECVSTVAELEERSRTAFLARDLKTLNSLWSDEFIVNSPINRIHSKEQVLALLKAGTISHISYEIQIERIEKRENVVIVMGSDKVINSPGSSPVSRRFTNVWRMENGALRMFIRHANIAPELPHSIHRMRD